MKYENINKVNEICNEIKTYEKKIDKLKSYTGSKVSYFFQYDSGSTDSIDLPVNYEYLVFIKNQAINVFQQRINLLKNKLEKL